MAYNSLMLQSLFVFDIETVPDTQVLPSLTGEHPKDEAQGRDMLEQYHLDITNGNNGFPRQPFHKVVAISFLEAEIERDGGNERYHLQELRTGGRVEATEEELLKGLFQHLSRTKPRFVSYNGRTFDLPVLQFRAMKYGITAPWLHQSGDKWNSYNSRYSADWHCDLLDVLTNYGAATRGLKLNEMCSILGLPGKLGIDGSKVATMYDDGLLKEIRDYCETDVLNTYLVYLHWQHHTGVLNSADFKRAMEDAAHYCANDIENRPHLGEFLEAWQPETAEAESTHE